MDRGAWRGYSPWGWGSQRVGHAWALVGLLVVSPGLGSRGGMGISCTPWLCRALPSWEHLLCCTLCWARAWHSQTSDVRSPQRCLKGLLPCSGTTGPDFSLDGRAHLIPLLQGYLGRWPHPSRCVLNRDSPSFQDAQAENVSNL